MAPGSGGRRERFGEQRVDTSQPRCLVKLMLCAVRQAEKA
jgi:hypothetical protein